MYKALIKSIVEDVDQKGRVKVAANAIGNVDSDKDMSMPGSFTKTLSENFSRVRWLQNHDKNLSLGVPLEGKEDGQHLVMVGQMNLEKQISKDMYSDYKLFAQYGKSLEHSIGVNAVKFQNKGNVRNVSEWKLWEYSSLTTWGSNPFTPVLDIKSLEDVNSVFETLDLMLRKGDYSDEKFKKIEVALTQLKSLVEPSNDTQVNKPNPLLFKALQQFNQSIKN